MSSWFWLWTYFFCERALTGVWSGWSLEQHERPGNPIWLHPGNWSFRSLRPFPPSSLNQDYYGYLVASDCTDSVLLQFIVDGRNHAVLILEYVISIPSSCGLICASLLWLTWEYLFMIQVHKFLDASTIIVAIDFVHVRLEFEWYNWSPVTKVPVITIKLSSPLHFFSYSGVWIGWPHAYLHRFK